jgi:hypothetical protein
MQQGRQGYLGLGVYEMIEGWDPHYAIGPKLIEYVIYCLEQASMEDNLIGVI